MRKIKRLFIFDFVKLMFKNLKDIYFLFKFAIEFNLNSISKNNHKLLKYKCQYLFLN
jgi:hypothetical protein